MILLKFIFWREKNRGEPTLKNFLLSRLSSFERPGNKFSLSTFSKKDFLEGVKSYGQYSSIIATSLSQFIFEGKVDDDLSKLSELSVEILMKDHFLEEWSAEDRDFRKKKLTILKDIFIEERG